MLNIAPPGSDPHPRRGSLSQHSLTVSSSCRNAHRAVVLSSLGLRHSPHPTPRKGCLKAVGQNVKVVIDKGEALAEWLKSCTFAPANLTKREARCRPGPSSIAHGPTACTPKQRAYAKPLPKFTDTERQAHHQGQHRERHSHTTVRVHLVSRRERHAAYPQPDPTCDTHSADHGASACSMATLARGH